MDALLQYVPIAIPQSFHQDEYLSNANGPCTSNVIVSGDTKATGDKTGYNVAKAATTLSQGKSSRRIFGTSVGGAGGPKRTLVHCVQNLLENFG
jgi:hypothetical protein